MDGQPLVTRGDPPRHTASVYEIKTGLEKLERFIEKGARDPTNPWAMAHGLIAFGKDLKTTDGRLAINAIIEDHLISRTEGSYEIRFFPPTSSSGNPVEPHPHLMLKAFVDAGVALDRTFRYADGNITLRQLLDDAIRTLRRPVHDQDWHRISWLLSTLGAHPPPNGRLMTLQGPFDFKELSVSAVERLAEDQGFLTPMFRQHRPDLVQKRRQPIYQHSCGGLHFIQGVGRVSARYPEIQPRFR
ncbi:MAG: hypothetical protein AAF449_08605, partial [Myxococcota bacterium]